jgi:hypothetical protein
MDSAEVVMREVKRQSRIQIVPFFAEDVSGVSRLQPELPGTVVLEQSSILDVPSQAKPDEDYSHFFDGPLCTTSPVLRMMSVWNLRMNTGSWAEHLLTLAFCSWP